MDFRDQHQAAVKPPPLQLPHRRMKRQVRDKEETVPFSVRFTKAEKKELEAKAGGLPLGTYVRSVVLDEKAPRQRTRSRNPVKDHKALAQVLGMLGQSHLANNLNQLVKAANIGALPVTPETEQELKSALADIRAMRDALIRALGLSGGSPS